VAGGRAIGASPSPFMSSACTARSIGIRRPLRPCHEVTTRGVSGKLSARRLTPAPSRGRYAIFTSERPDEGGVGLVSDVFRNAR
jgi:hypothetical protein